MNQHTDEIDKGVFAPWGELWFQRTGDRVAKAEAAAGSLAGLPDQDEPPQLRRPCTDGPACSRCGRTRAAAVERARRVERPSTRLARRAARSCSRGRGAATLPHRLGLPLGHEVLGRPAA